MITRSTPSKSKPPPHVEEKPHIAHPITSGGATLKSLSVIVIGKNEEPYISLSLRSAQAAIARFDDAEVVYVDSASTDRSVEIALALGVRVISLRPELELSPSAGRYAGFHHTSGELIMFLDADTTLEPDWLWKAVPWFDHPEVGAVAGFLEDFDAQGNLLPHVGEKSPTAHEIRTLRGSGLYLRSAMEQVGTFNPYLVTSEEAELALRLRRGGWKLMHLPYPMGRHLRGLAGLKLELRSLRLGRIGGCGIALRYACHEGTGIRFCFEYLRSTALFTLACLLLSPGLFLFLAGRPHAAKFFLWPILLGIVAIAIKKRSLLGPLDYVISHGLALFNLTAGALKTRIRDPRDYPLDAIEIKTPGQVFTDFQTIGLQTIDERSDSQITALDQLAEVWDSLAAMPASPMQQYIWSRACAEAFDADGRLQVVAIESAGRPLALAPLIKCGGIVPRLKMLGVEELYEPMDFLYAGPSQPFLLVEALAEMKAILHLGRLPADSPVIGAFRKAYRRGWIHTLPAASCPYITLNADWKEPERQFNSGRRSDFRRAQRHAEKMGSVSYEVLSPAPAELEPLLEEAYAVESAGWKGTKGTALTLDQARGNFYRRYAAAANEKGILRLCFLRIDGRAVAMQFAVECSGRFWLLKIGYDEQFARCSPGALLMLHTLRYAATNGLDSYEFLGLPEPWTHNWTQSLRPCVSLWAYPFNLQGIAAQFGDLGRFTWKAARRYLRNRS